MGAKISQGVIHLTPERWREVEALYHAVLERSPAERDALLSSADTALRREVESLLALRGGSGFRLFAASRLDTEHRHTGRGERCQSTRRVYRSRYDQRSRRKTGWEGIEPACLSRRPC
jgi:hypothetical protein